MCWTFFSWLVICGDSRMPYVFLRLITTKWNWKSLFPIMSIYSQKLTLRPWWQSESRVNGDFCALIKATFGGKPGMLLVKGHPISYLTCVKREKKMVVFTFRISVRDQTFSGMSCWSNYKMLKKKAFMRRCKWGHFTEIQHIRSGSNCVHIVYFSLFYVCSSNQMCDRAMWGGVPLQYFYMKHMSDCMYAYVYITHSV